MNNRMNKPLLSRLLPGAIAAAVIASTATFVIGPVDLAKVGNGNIAYREIEPGCLLLTMATSSPGEDLWEANSETSLMVGLLFF